MKDLFYEMAKALLSNDCLLSQLRKEDFQLGITEYFDGCGLGVQFLSSQRFQGLFHQIGLENVILTSSSMLFHPLADAIGVLSMPSFVPALRMGVSDKELAASLLLRVKNALFLDLSRRSGGGLVEGPQKAFDEKFPGRSPKLKVVFQMKSFLENLAARCSAVFSNVNSLLDFPRPNLHKVVDLGGISVPEPKPLSKVSFIVATPRVGVGGNHFLPSYNNFDLLWLRRQERADATIHEGVHR